MEYTVPNLKFIDQQIIQSKVKVYDLTKQINAEEERLQQLYGARETLVLLESSKDGLNAEREVVNKEHDYHTA